MHARANNAPKAQPPSGNPAAVRQHDDRSEEPDDDQQDRSPDSEGDRKEWKQREPHCELPPAVSPGGRGSPPRLPPRMPLRERPPVMTRAAL